MIKNKLTIDLSDENRTILEDIKKKSRSPYGNTINYLIKTFCNIPDSVKKELLEAIKPLIKKTQDQLVEAEIFKFKELTEKAQAYIDIATFLNDGQSTFMNETDTSKSMKKIPIKNGYLICPTDYIIINPEDAENMEYAGVIECRNSDKFGIPHLLFFTNKKYNSEYDSLYEDSILHQCCKIYPRFSEIMDMQVTPIDDPEKPGFTLNAKEWMNAPTIGFFHVYIQDDPRYGRNYNPPDGTRIVRTSV